MNFTMRYFIWSLMLVVGMAALPSCQQDRNLLNEIADSSVDILPADLPTTVQTYIGTNYPNQGISEAERYDGCGVYEVELDNGLELYFDLQGSFLGTEDDYACEDDDDYIDPDSLPANVLSYISTNYPNDSIEEAELEKECGLEVYEVELSNDVELYFDLQGSFLGTDDIFDCEDDDDSYDIDDDYVDPDSLPANVLTFISTNYPADSIESAEYEEECGLEVYEVELSSGLELYFDLQGSFLGTEDTFDCDDDD